MSMFFYIETDENGLIFSCFQSSKQAGSESGGLIQVDAHDTSYCGRYYLNGEVGPAPRDGYYWSWNSGTSQFEEVAIPTG